MKSEQVEVRAPLPTLASLDEEVGGANRQVPPDEIEPQLGAESFLCPHCNVVAHQDWFSLFLKPENAPDIIVLEPETAIAVEKDNRSKDEQLIERLKKHKLTYEYQKHSHNLKVKILNLHLSNCYKCTGLSVWVQGQLVFPIRIEETQHLVEQDFDEAAAILNKFPRGAAALIHICVQSLMPLLREQGRGLDENISSLVHKGLEVEIRQAMEVLQVLRKDPTQSSENDSRDDQTTEKRFFESVKTILQRRMLKKGHESQPGPAEETASLTYPAVLAQK